MDSGNQCRICFLTSHAEMARRGYRVNAFRYIDKKYLNTYFHTLSSSGIISFGIAIPILNIASPFSTIDSLTGKTGFEMFDITTLMGNVLQNALEAAVQTASPKIRAYSSILPHLPQYLFSYPVLLRNHILWDLKGSAAYWDYRKKIKISHAKRQRVYLWRADIWNGAKPVAIWLFLCTASLCLFAFFRAFFYHDVYCFYTTLRRKWHTVGIKDTFFAQTTQINHQTAFSIWKTLS